MLHNIIIMNKTISISISSIIMWKKVELKSLLESTQPGYFKTLWNISKVFELKVHIFNHFLVQRYLLVPCNASTKSLEI